MMRDQQITKLNEYYLNAQLKAVEVLKKNYSITSCPSEDEDFPQNIDKNQPYIYAGLICQAINKCQFR